MNVQNLSVGGAVTLWRAAKSTNRKQVEEGLNELGLKDLIPEARSLMSCLRAVLDDVYQPADKEERIVIRPIPEGFAVVAERPKEKHYAGSDWGRIMATVLLDETDFSITLDPFDQDKANAIANQMRNVHEWLTAGSVGKALVNLVEYLSGVGLRPNGGAYWINDDRLDEWGKIGDVFERASAKEDETGKPANPNAVYVLRVVADEQMVRAVGDALTTEIESAVAEIEAEITDATQNGQSLSERVADARLARVGKLLAKVRRYETAFDRPLQKLTDHVNRVGIAVAQATMLRAASGVSQPLTAGAC